MSMRASRAASVWKCRVTPPCPPRPSAVLTGPEQGGGAGRGRSGGGAASPSRLMRSTMTRGPRPTCPQRDSWWAGCREPRSRAAPRRGRAARPVQPAARRLQRHGAQAASGGAAAHGGGDGAAHRLPRPGPEPPGRGRGPHLRPGRGRAPAARALRPCRPPGCLRRAPHSRVCEAPARQAAARSFWHLKNHSRRGRRLERSQAGACGGKCAARRACAPVGVRGGTGSAHARAWGRAQARRCWCASRSSASCGARRRCWARAPRCRACCRRRASCAARPTGARPPPASPDTPLACERRLSTWPPFHPAGRPGWMHAIPWRRPQAFP